jgi:ParB-like chromosome segregation protein Spo0J
MKIQKVSIHQLKPAVYNPRIHLTPEMDQYQKLKRSLDEFGLVQPIVWNQETGNIVSGHQRFNILSDQGETEFDVIVVSMNSEKEKALNITLNNSHVSGDWDTEKLVDLVSDLAELPDFDETLTGFSQEEIKSFLFNPEYEIPESDIQDDEDTSNNEIKVLMKIPQTEWESVKAELDQILQKQTEIELHIL